MTDLQDRYFGSLLGLAAGDALGTTLEFKSPGTFTPLEDMIGGGPFGLKPGEWIDDTSMALCLAESLIERPTFDMIDQLDRYTRWCCEGYLSSHGMYFDSIKLRRDLFMASDTARTFLASVCRAMTVAPVGFGYHPGEGIIQRVVVASSDWAHARRS